MKLTLIKERDDGTADVQLDDIDPHSMQILLQEGFISIMEKAAVTNKTAALLKAPDAV